LKKAEVNSNENNNRDWALRVYSGRNRISADQKAQVKMTADRQRGGACRPLLLGMERR
jgi:hypothetical protein